jgi:hypothetical protein
MNTEFFSEETVNPLGISDKKIFAKEQNFFSKIGKVKFDARGWWLVTQFLTQRTHPSSPFARGYGRTGR